MSPVMNRQFSSLAEGLVAPRVLALVRLVTCVHVYVVLQVLGKSELLPAELTLESTGGVVDCQMSFKAVFVGVFLIAVWVSARKVLSLGIGQLVILLIVLDRA